MAIAAPTPATSPPKDVTFLPPIVRDAASGLNDLSCRLERLTALFRSNNFDLYDFLDELPDEAASHRGVQIWLIFGLAIEKLREAHEIMDAVNRAVHSPGGVA